jgi:chromosomal replication initiation ATPase DnaA
VGGGLLRSSGGWSSLRALGQAQVHVKGVGESDFVEEVLAAQQEESERRYWLRSQGYNMDRVVKMVAEVFKIEPKEICKPGNQPLRARARSLVCFWAVKELRMSGTDVGKYLTLTQSAVSRAVRRGEKLAEERNLTLVE